MKSVRGRCLQITPTQVTLINASGVSNHPYKSLTDESFKIGDIIEISNDGVIHVLTTSISKRSLLQRRILDPRRLKSAKIRNDIEAIIRDFFRARDFLEVRTPLLVQSPGMEAHIQSFQLKSGAFLPSSPEFAMKQLLVGGLENIFQICQAFRNEPFTQTHRPEFSMLEFYRAFSNEEVIQQDFEQLVKTIAMQFFAKPNLIYQNETISLQTPWPRFKVNELFIKHTQIDLRTENTLSKLKSRAGVIGVHTETSDTWDEIYFRIWLEKIEPKLPMDTAFFVTHYPASQAALATLEADENGFIWAKRFEAYIGGLELCNGFNELTDVVQQRMRFETEIELKAMLSDKETLTMPKDFISALEEGLPPSGGVAVGLDRLVMLFANENDIEYCLWLNPEATSAPPI